MSKLKLGLAQLLVEGGEPERNFERAFKLIDKSAEAGCDMVLLPETIDFAWTHPSGIVECHPIPGPFSELFCRKAQSSGLWICLGLTEKVDDKIRHNTALLINPKGEIVLKHRKINLLVVEYPFYEVGQKLEVIDSPFGKIGLNICADNYMDSLVLGHSLARMGAQLILSPSSWTVDYSITEEDDPYRDKWKKPLRRISELYGLIMVSTTSVGYIVGGPYEGKKMVGCSLVTGPDGIITEGLFNEFAGELKVVELDIPERRMKGTEIGKMLKNKGESIF